MSILYNLSQCPSQTVVYLHRDSSGMRVANSLSVSDEQSLLKKYEREKANCGGFIQFGFCLFVLKENPKSQHPSLFSASYFYFWIALNIILSSSIF